MHRQHYTPEPPRRASWSSVAVDVLQALTIAALIGAPFALYFWNMTL
jgi:hypothetical protein